MSRRHSDVLFWWCGEFSVNSIDPNSVSFPNMPSVVLISRLFVLPAWGAKALAGEFVLFKGVPSSE